MKIAILVEGKTETAFKEKLREFLKNYLLGQMPKLEFKPQDGRIPKQDKLRRVVENLLDNDGFDAVIALTDVYTGTNDFTGAVDAKTKMHEWVGDHPNFYPCVALHDFEAWLLPYWATIQKKSGHNQSAPSGKPESVNHNNPPSYRLKDIYRKGRGREYNKIADAKAILKDNDLMVAVKTCPELKFFINCIIGLCDPSKIIP
jgi:Domain of unknown function (DUF4276)